VRRADPARRALAGSGSCPCARQHPPTSAALITHHHHTRRDHWPARQRDARVLEVSDHVLTVNSLEPLRDGKFLSCEQQDRVFEW